MMDDPANSCSPKDQLHPMSCDESLEKFGTPVFGVEFLRSMLRFSPGIGLDATIWWSLVHDEYREGARIAIHEAWEKFRGTNYHYSLLDEVCIEISKHLSLIEPKYGIN